MEVQLTSDDSAGSTITVVDYVKAVVGRDPESNVVELAQTMRHWDCNLAELLPAKA